MLTIGKHKSVPIEPIRIGRVESHDVFEQSHSNGSHPDGRTPMAASILIADIEEKIAESQNSKGVVVRDSLRGSRPTIGKRRALQRFLSLKQGFASFNLLILLKTHDGDKCVSLMPYSTLTLL
jgi:hypothetical protein